MEPKFNRNHFIRVDQDEDHHYYSFGVPGFEICLEPCAAGFDVAIYADDGEEPEFKSAVEPKQCTKTGDYTQIDALFGDRKDEDWNKALAIADELLEKYVKNGKISDARYAQIKVREKLREQIKEQIQSLSFGLSNNINCFDEKQGQELITTDEIAALRARAKTITMQDGLRITMQGGFVPVIPMELKSGYGVSLTIIQNPSDRSPIEVFSVTYKGNIPDAADHIALAVLGKGYNPFRNTKGMLHYFKRRE